MRLKRRTSDVANKFVVLSGKSSSTATARQSRMPSLESREQLLTPSLVIRNHRERKANYIKALESEVVNLRKQNQQNIVALETEISTLRQMLMAYGIDPPPRQARVINASDEPVDAGPSSYSVTKPPGPGSPLQVHMPELSSQEGQVPPGFESYSNQQRATRSPSAPSGSPSPFSSPQEGTMSPALAQLMSSGSLDTMVGIDFVLA